jgi:GT2 family glycosyltransferase
LAEPVADGWPGISFVVPVKNGAAWLEETIRAIQRESEGREHEILLVDDGSVDGSAGIMARFAESGAARVVTSESLGAAHAINVGLRQARHPIIAQIDQDVRIQPGWLKNLMDQMRDPKVAAAQGWYQAARDATVWARVTGLDLEHRYSQLERVVDHVCTGNTLYRASALEEVGWFDEGLGYGYDNDLSYRLGAAGYQLVLCPEARSYHEWRETWWGYLTQQYGMGYGRIDLVTKHRKHSGGDDVSGFLMMMHAPATLGALGLMALAPVWSALGGRHFLPLFIGLAVLLLLAAERLVSGIVAWRRFHQPVGLLFPVVHFSRDLAWSFAIMMWCFRRLLRIEGKPKHSMMPEARVQASRRRRRSER